MSARQISTKEASRGLSRLLKEVAAGTEVVITARGRPIAVLGPYAGHRRSVLARLLARSAGLRGLTLRETHAAARRELEKRARPTARS
jgi:prevent-host-death family protein